MAVNKIKGITIEIEGNTQPLQKSLSDVNKNIREVQNELKQVENLLKLDPSNTELLSQKQKLLGDAVANTREKLDRLRDAQLQVNDQLARGKISEEQYRAFQREVAKTGQELKNLEEELGNVNNKWKDTAENLSNVGKTSEELGNKLTPISSAAAETGMTAIKMASDFADAMAKVSTIADTAEVPIDVLRKSILDLSNQTGVSASEIANNVYDAISAGQKTGDAVAFVESSTKLAKAGFAEAGQSLDILTTIMNEYGLEAEKVGEVSDMLIQVQNKGKVTVGELSSVMDKIIPTAKNLGINLDQVGAGYAIMTSNGIGAAEATTYMSSLLNELGETGSKADKELRDLTGKSFRELIEQGMSVADILALLDESAKKNGLSLNDMFGSAEAAKAALTLLGDDASNFNSMVEEMNNSLGATEEVFGKLQTPGEEARIAFNELKNVMIELGDVVLPVVAKIAEGIGFLAEKLMAMDDTTKTVIVVIGGIVAAVAPALIIIGKMATGISALKSAATVLTPALSELAPVIGFLTSPIGLVVVAIAGFIAAITYLWNTNEDFRNNIIDLWNKLVTFFTNTLDSIKTFFVNTWTAISNTLTTIVQTLSTFLVDKFGFVWTTIKEGFNAFKSLFEGDLKGFLSGIWNMALTWVTGWVNIGEDIVRGLWDGISSMSSWIKDKVSDFVGGITKSVKNVLGIRSPSKVFAGIGENMAEGLGVGFGAEIEKVKKEITNAMPTSSDYDVNVNTNSASTPAAYQGGDIIIQNMTVRDDSDIRLISRELYNLQKNTMRGVGVV